MVTGCDGGDAAGESRHICWCVPLVGGAVAKASQDVVAPAFDGAGGEQCTGVIYTGCDGGDAAGESGDVCWCVSICGGVIAELSVRVVAPAFDGAGGEQCTGLIVTGCDGGDAAGESRHICWCVSSCGGAVAKSSRAVVAPAFHGAGGEQCTGVKAIGCDGGDAAGESRHICWCIPIVGGAVTKVSPVVVAPAFDGAGGEQCTGVNGAGCDGGDATGESRHIYWCVPLVGGGAVAKFSRAVVAPAFDGAGGEQCTGVRVTGTDGGDAAGESGDVCWCVSICGGVVAELSVRVVAPAFDGAGGEQCTGVISTGCDG